MFRRLSPSRLAGLRRPKVGRPCRVPVASSARHRKRYRRPSTNYLLRSHEGTVRCLAARNATATLMTGWKAKEIAQPDRITSEAGLSCRDPRTSRPNHGGLLPLQLTSEKGLPESVNVWEQNAAAPVVCPPERVAQLLRYIRRDDNRAKRELHWSAATALRCK
jgi:hypothetical protein